MNSLFFVFWEADGSLYCKNTDTYYLAESLANDVKGAVIRVKALGYWGGRQLAFQKYVRLNPSCNVQYSDLKVPRDT